MKFISAALVIATLSPAASFVVQQQSRAVQMTSSSLQMGMFDFFSDDARKEREARKQREIEEQERLQQEILERRKNPELMEEYEAKIRVRRNLRMAGNDEMADMVKVFSDEKKEE